MNDTLCIALCCVYLTHVKLTKTQTSRTSFTIEQKVHFTIKVTEQQLTTFVVKSLFLSLRATQHFSKFLIISSHNRS